VLVKFDLESGVLRGQTCFIL